MDTIESKTKGNIESDAPVLQPLADERGTKRARYSGPEWGGGNVYLRNERWWIYYYAGGDVIRESSKSKNRNDAVLLLRKRVAAKEYGADFGDVFTKIGHGAKQLTKESSAATIGTVSELLVCADLLNNNLHTFRAVSSNCPCDLIAMDKTGAIVKKIEVKTGVATDNGKAVKRHSKIFRPDAFDILAVVTRNGGIFYQPPLRDVFPLEEPRAKAPRKYKQREAAA